MQLKLDIRESFLLIHLLQMVYNSSTFYVNSEVEDPANLQNSFKHLLEEISF